MTGPSSATNTAIFICHRRHTNTTSIFEERWSRPNSILQTPTTGHQFLTMSKPKSLSVETGIINADNVEQVRRPRFSLRIMSIIQLYSGAGKYEAMQKNIARMGFTIALFLSIV